MKDNKRHNLSRNQHVLVGIASLSRSAAFPYFDSDCCCWWWRRCYSLEVAASSGTTPPVVRGQTSWKTWVIPFSVQTLQLFWKTFDFFARLSPVSFWAVLVSFVQQSSLLFLVWFCEATLWWCLGMKKSIEIVDAVVVVVAVVDHHLCLRRRTTATPTEDAVVLFVVVAAAVVHLKLLVLLLLLLLQMQMLQL